MRAAVIALLCLPVLAACGGAGSSLSRGGLVPPVQTGAATPPPSETTPTPTAGTATPLPQQTPAPDATPFAASNVRVAEYPQPVTPLYLAAAADGSVYFGYGANGTGSNLYRFDAGTQTQTAPAPPANGYAPGGGVYGITVAQNTAVYWLSAYFGNGSAPFVQVQCGGTGGTATLCQNAGVDEPTSMLVDASGTFWIGGLGFNGGGQVATSSGALGNFPGAVMQLLTAQDGTVWGVLQNSQSGSAQYAIAQFAQSGGSIAIARQYTLPGGESIGSMTLGADGAFWFTDVSQNAIGRITESGAVREFALPSASALGQPWYGQWQIASACDGAVWFSEPGADAVGRIDMQGHIDQVALPAAQSSPGPIAAVPARGASCPTPALWVGEQATNAIASISL